MTSKETKTAAPKEVHHQVARLSKLLTVARQDSQQTNKHTFRCKAFLNWEHTKIKMTGIMATLRVKLTLTKFQRMFRKRELETNYSCSQNCNQQNKKSTQ